jgi:hypothetical protein
MQTSAREVRKVIMQDNVDPPLLPRANQNIIVASMSLRDLPEPEDHEGRRKVVRLRALHERAALQQVESSAAHEASARDREPPCPQRDDHVASEPAVQPDRPPI